VSALSRLPVVLDTQLQRDAGINFFEYLVMAALSEAPERTMRLSDVAARAEGSLPRLSQAIRRLETRGWIQRRPDPSDGRYTLGTLTEDGYDKIVATAPGHVEAVRRSVFDPLTKAQQRQLGEICRRIVHSTEPGPAVPRLPRQSAEGPVAE
jgi:DNA-binding MarR family transcriptional regulator